jgi:DUF218 domain
VTKTAIIVPGSHLGSTRRRLVRCAERVAAASGAALVVFSGEGEAADMCAGWRGPDVELVVEETATSTAENAALALPLLRERGVRAAIVVCAPAHLLRARWIFRRLFRAAGIDVRFQVARVIPTPAALVWEIAAAAVARRQVRRLER